MIRHVAIIFYMLVPILVEQWRQISGPPIPIQVSQFVVPSISRAERVIISYTQTVDNQFSEDFISVQIVPVDVPE